MQFLPWGVVGPESSVCLCIPRHLPTRRHASVRSISLQDGIMAIGKAHTRYIPPATLTTSTLPLQNLQTVPKLVRLNTLSFRALASGASAASFLHSSFLPSDHQCCDAQACPHSEKFLKLLSISAKPKFGFR